LKIRERKRKNRSSAEELKKTKPLLVKMKKQVLAIMGNNYIPDLDAIKKIYATLRVSVPI